MKNKFIIFIITILTAFLGFLVINNINNKNVQNDLYEKFINRTIEIKEKLLKESTTVTRSIEGKIFMKDESKLPKNIELILYKEDNNTYKKTSITYTNENGNYKFDNLEIGNYKIKLETNEDFKIVNEDTIITIDDDIYAKNMDIEILETDIFKAQINKYIKQIKLIEDSNQKTYNYDKQNKVIIPLKNIKNISGTVEYEFEVTNIKSKEGFVKVIKDKLPDGLSFNQEKNPLWKEKNGYLYTNQLSNTILKVNGTRVVPLILDINNTNEGRVYLNSVSITGEIYHKVTFINLGNIYSESSVLDGDTTTQETTPTLLGFKFTGWYKDIDNKELFDFKEPITEDTKIYAGWQKEVNVKYMVDNNLYKEETIYEGEKTNKPVDPYKEGYTFDNWYSDPEYKKVFDFNQKLTEDTIIYGKLDKNIVYYNVTYIIDDSEFAKEMLMSGSKIENKIVPNKENKELNTRIASYVFDGWYEDDKFTKKFNFENGVEKDTNLYGKYIENLSCKTRDNVKIPTKEDITNSISYKINKVDLNENNANISLNENNNSHIIIDGFEAEYYDNTNSSYKIINYTNDTMPDNLIIPDTIFDKPVISISNSFNDKTINDLKISSNIQDISNSFNNVTINGNVDFQESINLSIIKESFNTISFNNIDLGNSIKLESIIDSFKNSNGNKFIFNNTIALTNISNLLKESIVDSIDLGNSINLVTLQENSFSNLTVNNLSFSNTISLTTIEKGAFKDSLIKNLDFGNSINLSSIDPNTFTNLDIEELNMSKLFSYENINNNTFNSYNTNNKINKVILSSITKNIGEHSFSSLGIEEVDMSCAKDSLESVEFMSFNNNNIKEVNFIGFSKLKNLDISSYTENPIKVIKLQDLPSLTNLKYNGGNFKFTEENEGLIIDNTALSDINLAASFSNTGMKQLVIENNPNLESLSNVLHYEYDINKVVIQNNPNLTEIKYEAFYWVPAKELIIKDLPKLKIINDEAFTLVVNVDNITLEDLPSLEKIGTRAFSSWGNPLNAEYVDHTITLRNLPELKIIGDEAFMRTNITEINLVNLPKLTEIARRAFSYNKAENINLTGENLPSLTKIGSNAFSAYASEKSIQRNIVLKDLLNLTSSPADAFGNVSVSGNIVGPYEKMEFINLPLVTGLGSFGNGAYVKNLVVKDCENLNLNNTNFITTGNKEMQISKLILDNLPKTTSIGSYKFVEQNITELDLSGLQNLVSIEDGAFNNNPISKLILPDSLQSIGSYAFYNNSITELELPNSLQSIKGSAFISNSIEKIKIPETVQTIGNGAFAMLGGLNTNLKCIEIKGDSTRFNSIWNQIGLPNSLTPGTCAFTNTDLNVLNNLSANVTNANNKNIDEKIYNIVLYKMDNNELIDNNKTYKLQKLTTNGFIDMNILEDIENVGRYSLHDRSNDKIKSFNNKVYLTNITQGTYKLINESDSNDTLTFIIESTGEVTGNAKINIVNNNDKIMSSSEAEFITTIQTGSSIKNYLLAILLLGTSVLYLIKRKIIKG